MMKKTRIAVFGGTNMDICGHAEAPLRLRDSNIGRISLQPGGVGRNIAARLVENGAQCELFTVLGSDAMASALRADCQQRGIDISHALQGEGSSCVYLCMHDTDGDMLLAMNDMALASHLDCSYVQSVLPALQQCDLCVLDANAPADTLAYLAKQLTIPTLLDPVSCAKAQRVRAALPHLTAIKPNIYEARALTGQEDPEDCAQALLHLGVKQVFISMGEKGVLYADQAVCETLPVNCLTNAAKTGAGDAMCAGIAIAMANGKDTAQCAADGMRSAQQFLLVNQS